MERCRRPSDSPTEVGMCCMSASTACTAFQSTAPRRGPSPKSTSSGPPHGPRPSKKPRAGSSKLPTTCCSCMPSGKRHRAMPTPTTATCSTHWRRASCTKTRPTRMPRARPSKRTCSSPFRWTDWSAAMWVLAKRKSPSGRPSERRATASKWPCWCPRPSYPCSITRASADVCASSLSPWSSSTDSRQARP